MGQCNGLPGVCESESAYCVQGSVGVTLGTDCQQIPHFCLEFQCRYRALVFLF